MRPADRRTTGEGAGVDAYETEATMLPAARRRKANRRTALSHRLEYALVRALAVVLRRVPVGAASAAMGGLLWAVMPLTSRHGRVLQNLAFAMPERSGAERRAIARAMWMHLGRVAGEAFLIDRIMQRAEERITFPPEFETLRPLAAEGVIGATLHLGNWELAGLMARAGGVRFAGVYQALHNPLVERYLRSLRLHLYPAGLFPKGGELGATLLGLARQGVGIGLVADLREMRGVDVTFFGHPAFATPLPAMLARATGKPILAGAMVRTGGARFRALMEPIHVNVTDDRERDIREATQALHDVFERWIRAHPQQWMWTHRKWARTRAQPLPPGDGSIPLPVDSGAESPAPDRRGHDRLGARTAERGTAPCAAIAVQRDTG